MHRLHCFLSVAVLATVLDTGPALADDQVMCANAQQAAEINAFYAENNAVPPMAARRLKMPEAVIASAFPSNRAVGTTGAVFHDVWDKLTTLDEAMVLLIQGGHVFEMRGKVPPGEASTRSKYFNIGYRDGDGGLTGHLRPDLVTAIYAFVLPGEGGVPVRSVFFYGASGGSDFGIVVAAGESEETAERRSIFDAIWLLMEAGPRVCG